MMKPASRKRLVLTAGAAGLLALLSSGCDLLTVSQTGRNIREGNEAVVRGEMKKALQHYETALDGTLLSAEAHYRLGLLYEDQLKNEVGALHHFERYLELAPQGQFATDVKGYVERLRLTLVSRLAEGTVLPAREASRLKNENLELRRQLNELRQGQPPTATVARVAEVAPTPSPTPVPAPVQAAVVPVATPAPTPVATPEPEVRRAIAVTPNAAPSVTAEIPRAEPVGGSADGASRTYTVQKGDTLAAISRKFYRNSNQWQKIADANKDILPDPTKLKIGMVLNIPH